MGERDYTLRLHETKGVRVGASVVGMVSPFALVAILADRAVPDSVGGLELFTKTAAMGER